MHSQLLVVRMSLKGKLLLSKTPRIHVGLSPHGPGCAPGSVLCSSHSAQWEPALLHSESCKPLGGANPPKAVPTAMAATDANLLSF